MLKKKYFHKEYVDVILTYFYYKNKRWDVVLWVFYTLPTAISFQERAIYQNCKYFT